MSDSKRYSTLVNNTILFAISNFGSKIISLIIQPYLSYALASPDVMGVTSLMQSVANLLIPVVSLGVSFAVIRFGLDRKVDKSSVFMNGLATILLGFALMAVCWPLVRLIPNCRALPPVFQFQKVQQSPLEGHAALLHPHDPGFHQLLDHQRIRPVLCTGHV